LVAHGLVLKTIFMTEQCNWNKSGRIEVVSHVEKTCSPCCSYNWSMVEHIPGSLRLRFALPLLATHAYLDVDFDTLFSSWS
jgi:hypothetical protein